MQKSNDESSTALVDDGFSVQDEAETMREFCDRYEELGDGMCAYITTCQHCDRDVIAINHLPTMFMLNVCYPDGLIFSSVEVCPECVFDILKRSKSKLSLEAIEKSSTYGH